MRPGARGGAARGLPARSTKEKLAGSASPDNFGRSGPWPCKLAGGAGTRCRVTTEWDLLLCTAAQVLKGGLSVRGCAAG